MAKSFSDSDLHEFFQLIGRTLKARGNGQYMTNCPFPENHNHGDKAASFSIISGNIPGFKCFGCGVNGSIFKLAKLINESRGDDKPLRFVREFMDSKDPMERLKGVKDFASERSRKYTSHLRRVEVKKRTVVEKDLEYFGKEIPMYAIERGMTKQQIIKWEIGYDPRQDRMIIPVRDAYGVFYGVSGRDLSGKSKIKYRHYTGLNRDAVLYGERFIDIKIPRVYLVEGFFDVYGLERNGLKNVFATMGTSLSEYNINKICRYFKEVIFIPDGGDNFNDEVVGLGAGIQFAETYAKIFYKRGLRVGIASVEYNKEYKRRKEAKPPKWLESDYRFRIISPLLGKDPEELTKEETDQSLSLIKWLDVTDL